MDTATTEIYTFPYTTLFRSTSSTNVDWRCAPRDSSTKAFRLYKRRLARHGCASSRRRSSAGCIASGARSEEHTSELQSLTNLVCRLLLEKKKKQTHNHASTP